MRTGVSPSIAAAEAIKPIVKYYPSFSGAVVAANIRGEHGKIMDNFFQKFHVINVVPEKALVSFPPPPPTPALPQSFISHKYIC